jgi:hypothetical protein
MAILNEPDNTPLPGTVFTPRQVRVLKIAVIEDGYSAGRRLRLRARRHRLSGIAGRARDGAPAAVLGEGAGELAIAKDATISSMSLDGGRLAPSQLCGRRGNRGARSCQREGDFPHQAQTRISGSSSGHAAISLDRICGAKLWLLLRLPDAPPSSSGLELLGSRLEPRSPDVERQCGHCFSAC